MPRAARKLHLHIIILYSLRKVCLVACKTEKKFAAAHPLTNQGLLQYPMAAYILWYRGSTTMLHHRIEKAQVQLVLAFALLTLILAFPAAR